MPSHATRFLQPVNRRAVLTALAALGLAPATPPASAKKKKKCTVPPTSGLRAFVDQADPGSTLRLCGGTFPLSPVLTIAKDLTIVGAGPGATTLSSNVVNAGTIVTVAQGVTAVLQGLTVTGGSGFTGDNESGGGIQNAGTLTLKSVAVRGNRAEYGGGIRNTDTGQLTLDHSTVAGNTAFQGGGVFNAGLLTVRNGGAIGGKGSGDANFAVQGAGLYNDALYGEAQFAKGTKATGNLLRCDSGSTPCEGGGVYNGRSFSGDHTGLVILATTTIVTRNRYENSATISNCAGVAVDNCLETT